MEAEFSGVAVVTMYAQPMAHCTLSAYVVLTAAAAEKLVLS